VVEKLSNFMLGQTFSSADLRAYRTAQYLLLSIGILSLSALLLAFCLLFPIGQAPLAIFTSVVAVVYLLNFGVLRLTNSLTVTSVVFVLEQCLVVFSLNYLYGGNRPEFYIWYPSIVLMATFLLNKRWGLAVAILMAVTTIYLEYLVGSGYQFPPNPLYRLTSANFGPLISVPLAMLVIALLSWLFEDIRAVGEEQLRSSERRLRTHVEQTQLAVIETNNRSVITAWNPAAELIFGYRADEALGKNIVDLLVLPADRPTIAALLNQLRHSREVILNSNQNMTKDGSVVACDWYNTPLVDENNQIIGKAAMAVDVTKRNQYEEALRVAKEQAEESTRAKSEFLARMSHEIRTPMNGVIGMTNLLLETNLEPEQRDFAETIRRSSEALITIINEILDFSKIESGKMALEAHPFDLHECIEDALDLLTPQAAAKHLELAYLIEEQVPAILIGDVTRLRQVLVNLLANAVKFTMQGEVYLHVERKDAESQPEGQSVEILFTIQDTGIGIPNDRIYALFQSFTQSDDSVTRRFGGTGLGLAISKHLCELMGGAMWVHSVIGQGSSFYFTICAGLAENPQHAPQAADAALATRRVLIVDENATNRRLLKQYVTRWNMFAVDVSNGAAAINLLKQGGQFDVALLNIIMPETDGLALAQEIRQLRTGQELPLVMLTSITGSASRQRARKLNAVAFLNKPVKPAELYAILVNQLRPSSRIEQTRPKLTMTQIDLAQKKPLTILLAEDNLINQKVALRILERLGYRADAVANGLEAVKAVRRQPYDVILMDMHMPEMDGVEATRQILQEYTGEHPPFIIAMTAAAMPADKARCIEAGMQDFLPKPIQLTELVNILQRRQLHSATAPE